MWLGRWNRNLFVFRERTLPLFSNQLNERIMGINAETIRMWKDGLWEDYNAGRISGDALEEELKDIEELEKSLQP